MPSAMALTFTLVLHPISQHRLPPTSQRRAPRTFTRITRGNGHETLETSSITFRSNDGDKRVTLHAMIHVADADHYQLPAHSSTLYELIVSNSLTSSYPPLFKVRTKIQASASARATARALNAVAQSDALDYTNGWIADKAVEDVKSVGTKNEQRGLTIVQLAALLLPAPELFFYLSDLPRLGVKSLWGTLSTLDFVGIRRAAFMHKMDRSCKDRAFLAGDKEDILREEVVARGIQDQLQQVEDVGVVYGAWHMGRLCRRVEDELGLEFEKLEWRKAMSVRLGTGWGGIVVVMWLVAGGGDWIHVWIAEDWSWYFVRHFLLGMVLVRWLGVGTE